MKCHYVWGKEAGSVLIPGCWSVVISGDMNDCVCRNDLSYSTFAGYERMKYNEEIKEKNTLIKDLERENSRLNRIIKNLLKQ